MILDFNFDPPQLVDEVPFSRSNMDFTVPKGFQFDGMTVPWFMRSLVGGSFRHRTLRPALIHDYLYSSKVTSRELADVIFLDELRAAGTRCAWVLYAGVRLFGWIYWGAKAKGKV